MRDGVPLGGQKTGVITKVNIIKFMGELVMNQTDLPGT